MNHRTGLSHSQLCKWVDPPPSGGAANPASRPWEQGPHTLKRHGRVPVPGPRKRACVRNSPGVVVSAVDGEPMRCPGRHLSRGGTRASQHRPVPGTRNGGAAVRPPMTSPDSVTPRSLLQVDPRLRLTSGKRACGNREAPRSLPAPAVGQAFQPDSGGSVVRRESLTYTGC